VKHLYVTTAEAAAAKNHVGSTNAVSALNRPQAFITVNQLLALLPISRRKLADDIKAGKIPCVKLGNRLLFHWPTVESKLLRQAA
jgi:hypothetical protein